MQVDKGDEATKYLVVYWYDSNLQQIITRQFTRSFYSTFQGPNIFCTEKAKRISTDL